MAATVVSIVCICRLFFCWLCLCIDMCMCVSCVCLVCVFLGVSVVIFVRLGWFVCLADRCRSLVWSVRLKSSWFMWGILKRPNCSGCRDLLLTLEVPGYHSHRCPLLFSCVLPCSSHFLFVPAVSIIQFCFAPDVVHAQFEHHLCI